MRGFFRRFHRYLKPFHASRKEVPGVFEKSQMTLVEVLVVL